MILLSDLVTREQLGNQLQEVLKSRSGMNFQVFNSEYLRKSPKALKLRAHLHKRFIDTASIPVQFAALTYEKLANSPDIIGVRMIQEKSAKDSLYDFETIISDFFSCDSENKNSFVKFFSGSYSDSIVGITENEKNFKNIELYGSTRRDGLEIAKAVSVQPSCFGRNDIKSFLYLAGFGIFDLFKEVKSEILKKESQGVNLLGYVQNAHG